MNQCIFCKIVNLEIPSSIVYSDTDCQVFLDNNPVNEGHLLLVPKSHYEQMEDVPDDLLARLFVKVKAIRPKLKRIMKADYVSVSVAGNEINHFHIHLVPRYFKDGHKEWRRSKYETNTEKELAAKIKKELSL